MIRVLLFSSVQNAVKQILLGRIIVENWLQNMHAQSAALKAQTKMAKAGITIQIMPESIEVDLKELENRIKEVIIKTYGEVGEIRVSEEPIAFGLVSLKFICIIDEKQGTDIIEEALLKLEGIGNARVVDFRRAIG